MAPVVTTRHQEPSTNVGLAINPDTDAAADSSRVFASSEAADPSTRPRLVILYR